MKNPTPLMPGNFYHIYTKGVNGSNLFNEQADYRIFLQYYNRFIEPIANTFAWCLMRNHLHVLIQTKKNIRYKLSEVQKNDPLKWETTIIEDNQELIEKRFKKPVPSKHLAHFFNTYAKYYNNKYERNGVLFERPFRRKLINNLTYFKNVVIYIHQNPVHHGFCSDPIEYRWSSYLTCVSVKPTNVKRETVIGWFDDVAGFKNAHDEKINVLEMENWLGFN